MTTYDRIMQQIQLLLTYGIIAYLAVQGNDTFLWLCGLAGVAYHGFLIFQMRHAGGHSNDS